MAKEELGPGEGGGGGSLATTLPLGIIFVFFLNFF